MQRIVNYTPIIVSLFLIFIYFILFYMVGYKLSKFSADALAIALVSFMMASTTPEAVRAIRNGISTGPQKLIFSYWFLWTILFFRTCFSITMGLMNRPIQYLEGPIPGLIGICLAIGGGFGIAAPLSGPDPLHRRAIITMTIAGIVMGIVIGLISGLYIVTGFVE